MNNFHKKLSAKQAIVTKAVPTTVHKVVVPKPAGPPSPSSSDDAASVNQGPTLTPDTSSNDTPKSAAASRQSAEKNEGDSPSSRFSTTTKLESESISIFAPPPVSHSKEDDSSNSPKFVGPKSFKPTVRGRPIESFEARPNYLERIRWILVSLPLLATLWGALPPEQFLVVLQLVITVAVAYVIGTVIGLIPRIPPLLGMMAVGTVLSNAELVVIPPEVAAKLRSMALAIILLRAGIGLDLAVLRKLSMTCLRLTFLPCFTEAFMVTLVAHYLLDLPFLWGLLLGFVLAAVSPAVVVPAMIDLTQRKLGTNKGIPTLITAASSFDDVAAITGFGVVLAMIFQSSEEDSLAWTILSGPIEALLGLFGGGLLGVIIAYMFPANRDGCDKLFDLLCPIYIVLAGAAAIFVSNRIGWSGVGPLAAITASAAAVLVWKKQAATNQTEDITQIMSCSLFLKYLWLVFEPVLFSMIGLEFRFSKLNPEMIQWGILTLVICLTVRIAVTYLAVSFSTLNGKERAFVCVAWLPKATVQAALAPTALDMVRSLTSQGKPVEEGALVYSETVLTLGVLAIIITAPIGALAISILAPKLLVKEAQTLALGAEEQVIPLKGPDTAEDPRI